MRFSCGSRTEIGILREACRPEPGAGCEPDVLGAVDHPGDRGKSTAEIERRRQQFVASIRLIGEQRSARDPAREGAGRGHRATARRAASSCTNMC